MFPKSDEVTIHNALRYTNRRCRRSYLRPVFTLKNSVLEIRGRYSPKCGQQFVMRAVSSPETHIYHAFREKWQELGGTLKGTYRLGQVTAGDKLHHVGASPTLGEQIRLMNKWSNNVMTRQLFLSIGAKQENAPADYQKARKAVMALLNEKGVNTMGLMIENGSGLSRTARLSVQQMTALLEHAYHDAAMPEFMASLSLMGIDGTMATRFRRDELRGMGHFKTGTINQVSSIAGYLLTRSGKRLAIAIILNGKRVTASPGGKIQNALLRWSFEQ